MAAVVTGMLLNREIIKQYVNNGPHSQGAELSAPLPALNRLSA
jgi:hypothetical protein